MEKSSSKSVNSSVIQQRVLTWIINHPSVRFGAPFVDNPRIQPQLVEAMLLISIASFGIADSYI